MKKIFILPILIAPIIAHATDPVGPAHVNSGAVVATAPAPYATAREETGDTTNVVSASYVKGAYNDAIAAINNVADELRGVSSYVNNDIEDEIAEKQDKLTILESGDEISSDVVGVQAFEDEMLQSAANGAYGIDNFFDDKLITAGAVATGILAALNRTGVKAVTTWGSNSETTLGFVPN